MDPVPRGLGSSGREYSLGEARVEGVGPPMAPPLNLNLVGFTSRFTSVSANMSKFTSILGLDCM